MKLILLLICFSISVQAQTLLLSTNDSIYSTNNLSAELVSKRAIFIPSSSVGFFHDYEKILWKDIIKIQYNGSNKKLFRKLEKHTPPTTLKDFNLYSDKPVSSLEQLELQLQQIQQNRKIGKSIFTGGIILGVLGYFVQKNDANNGKVDTGKALMISGSALCTIGIFIK